MAETKWTPGPWKAECCSLAEAKANGSFDWMSMGFNAPLDRAPEFRVGSVWKLQDGGYTGLPGSLETTEANAHLIASAPDLYRALEALQRRIVEADLWHGQEDELDAATAALAKARGEQ